MVVTRVMVAEELRAYLSHEIALDALVDWAETAMMEAEFDEKDGAVRDVVARLGLADVRAFGLAWEDCERMLTELGFAVQLNIVAV
jgi:cobyrinic acid a,c-diamide synthase